MTYPARLVLCLLVIGIMTAAEVPSVITQAFTGDAALWLEKDPAGI